MKGEKSDHIGRLHLRARTPKIFGIVAIVLLLVTVGVIIYSAYRSRSNPDFRMQGFPTTLSKDVVAVINGYERREMDGDHTRYLIRADKATSFADNHQELENVHLEVFEPGSSASEKITAQKAVYVPGHEKFFAAYFAGSVNIETRDRLRVKTEQLTYSNQDEVALAEELIEFERLNVRGRSIGASVNAREKLLKLNRDVEIYSEGSAERSTLKAGRAVYDQANEKIELTDSVAVAIESFAGDQPEKASNFTSGKATAFLDNVDGEQRTLDRVELMDTVRIETRQGQNSPTKISSNYALYQKPIDRFQLRDAVHIVTVEDQKPTDIRADNAVYQQPQGLVDLTGNASITQGASFVQGGVIHAELTAGRKLKLADVQIGAYAKQASSDSATEVSGTNIKAVFGDDHSIRNATVSGPANAVLVPVNPAEYSRVSLAAASKINVGFKGDGLLDKILTEGRTKVRMDVPNRSADAANKELSADSVSTAFGPTGKDISVASAVGKAELVVTPLAASETNFKTTVNAQRFDCDFFQTGNDLKTCTASQKTRTVRIPTTPSVDRGTQNITADKLVAVFGEQSRELESLDGTGGAEFTERDRNATAERMIYTTADETVRLRGGEPRAWDSKARAKAPEIDWNTKDQFSELRGGASTTYYSPKSTGNTAPFGRSEKPVYVTASSARFDHKTDVAIYTGNARGWQDKNYVRGERMTFSERDGRFVAEENVHSLLYESKRTDNGVESNQPIYVTAQKLTYVRDGRQLRYENNVDIRQGKDRITGGVANVFLNEENAPIKTEIEQNVIMTQPNRRATGSYARYESAGEMLFLRGDPAVVEDAEQGRSQGAEITVDLKENRFTSNGPSRQNSSGRIRSVYKVKTQ